MVLSAISNIFKPNGMTTHTGIGPTAAVGGFALTVHAVASAIFLSTATTFIKAEFVFGATLMAGALFESLGVIALATVVGLAVLKAIP